MNAISLFFKIAADRHKGRYIYISISFFKIALILLKNVSIREYYDMI